MSIMDTPWPADINVHKATVVGLACDIETRVHRREEEMIMLHDKVLSTN